MTPDPTHKSRRDMLTTMAATGLGLAGLASLLPEARAEAPASPAFFFNVRDFGAKGDGTTDDGAAFQAAIDAASAVGGAIVLVPAGRYLFKGSLLLKEAVTLQGVWSAPARPQNIAAEGERPAYNGSVLLVTGGKGEENGEPFIKMSASSTLQGVTIFYPEQAGRNPPIPYPWTVQGLAGDNVSIIDVLMINPYSAVDFGTFPSGRHYIRGLYAQPLYRGLYIDRCLDVGRVENVHFWPFWTGGQNPVDEFTMQHGIAFVLGRSDWELMTNCFCISFSIGFHFVNSEAGPDEPYAGPGNYLITNGGPDLCQQAIRVERAQGHAGVSFVNCQIYGDIEVGSENTAPVRFTACGIFGSVNGLRRTAMARLAGEGRTSFSNCSFTCIDARSKAATEMIVVESGRIAIQGCVFLNNPKTEATTGSPTPLVLRAPVRAAIIEGNEFYGPATIVNEAKGTTLIQNNLENTEADPA